MTQDRVIYTDGRHVVVTDSMLRVKNTAYRLNGITKLCMWTIRPERWPAVVLLLLGLAASALGFLNLLPPEANLSREDGYVSANTVARWAGLALAFLGLLALVLGRERYAVRIGTAEGDKNAVVSSRREYIAQIVDALHSAFDLGHTNRPVAFRK